MHTEEQKHKLIQAAINWRDKEKRMIANGSNVEDARLAHNAKLVLRHAIDTYCLENPP
jgi:hypothetical protein